MRSLLRLAIANPIAVVLFVVVTAWGGAFALLHLPVGLFPAPQKSASGDRERNEERPFSKACHGPNGTSAKTIRTANAFRLKNKFRFCLLQ